MVKYFCDVCETEITKQNDTSNLKSFTSDGVIIGHSNDGKTFFKLKLSLSKNNTWNDAIPCKSCLGKFLERYGKALQK